MASLLPQRRIWLLKTQPKYRHGYADGEQYPSLFFEIRGGQLTEEIKSSLWGALNQSLPKVPEEFEACFALSGLHEDDLASGVSFLLSCVHRAQLGCGHPVFLPGRLLSSNAQEALLSIPVWPNSDNAIARAVIILLMLFDQLSSGQPVVQALAHGKSLATELQEACSYRIGSSRFVRVAIEDGIPFHHFFRQVTCFGQGIHQRWLDLTFTDKTSRLGAIAARHKHLGAQRLRAAGIPVPEHYLITTLEAARVAALKIGFPVVIKPADMDGGLGVTAGVFEETELEPAFVKARACGTQILVEKYFHGRDYRLVVMDGALVLALERIPAGITGDGVSTVEALVNAENSDPRRGVGQDATLQKIELDDEALRWLARNGMSTSFVPSDGCFVRLKGAANIAAGGHPVSILEKVHPDNRLLAIRAVAAMRLDIAGVDLLIPDISRSWMDGGAAVCEVNAQPALGPVTAGPLYRQILKHLMTGTGRIPVSVVLGASEKSSEVKEAVAAYRNAGLCVGWHDAAGVHINDTLILPGPIDTYTAGHLLFQEENVAAAVVSVSETSILDTGLPMDRYDRLIIAGRGLRCRSGIWTDASEGELNSILRALLPACQREIFVSSAGLVEERHYRGVSRAAWVIARNRAQIE